jgi:CheY-like chemotaxis protein
MDVKDTSPDSVGTDSYDASEKPFDYVEEGGKTALLCETDSGIRERLESALKKMGYYVTKVGTSSDALKSMRFHGYDLIAVGENSDTDVILDHIRRLPMGVRRNIFVILLSGTIRTMDNMAAFARSVNLVINREHMDEAEAIIGRGIADNEAFYQTFREALKEAGRL